MTFLCVEGEKRLCLLRGELRPVDGLSRQTDRHFTAHRMGHCKVMNENQACVHRRSTKPL